MIYKYQTQTKLGSINLKPKAFEDGYYHRGAKTKLRWHGVINSFTGYGSDN